MGIVITISASTTPTADLQEKAQIIAHEYGVASSTLFAIIESETGGTWKTDQICDGGDGRGLGCINKRWFPDEYEQALDPDFSMRFIAQAIKDLKADDLWTGCNCYKTLLLKVDTLPKMADIVPNTSLPVVGGIAIFRYGKTKHVSFIERVEYVGSQMVFYVFEGNYIRCKIAKRMVKLTDKSLIGFAKYE